MARTREELEPLTSQLIGEVNEEYPAVGSDADSAITPLLIFSIVIAICGSFVYGAAMGYTSPIESAIMDDLDLSTTEVKILAKYITWPSEFAGWSLIILTFVVVTSSVASINVQFSIFGSILTVGGLLGSVVSGKITDLIGRRGAMGLSNTINIIGWIAIAISEKAWSLDLGRILVGAATGISLYVVPIYIAEITPKNLRGGLVSLTQLMISSGVFVMFIVGSVISWRILAVIGIIPSVLQLLGIFLIPESPRFLAKLGHNKALEIVLRRLRGDKIDISQEAASIEEFTKSLKQTPEVSFWGLFQRRYARSLVVVLVLMTSSGFAGPTAVTYYASSVFEAAGFSSSFETIVMAFVQVPSAVIGVYLIDKCGRRPLLMISAGAMCFCCFLVAFMFLFKDSVYLETVGPYVIVLGLWGFSAAFRLGMSGIPYLIMSEMFPMNVKGSAGSLAVVVTGLATWIISYAFNFMTDWSYSGTFFVLGWANAFTVLFVAKLVPETKGKTLEEIQESSSHVLR